jgi:hypothetical protein
MKKIILVIMSAFFLSGCNRMDQHQPLTSTVAKFSEGETITQSIYSSRPNLNTVSICLRNVKRELIPMTFTLSQGGSIVRTMEFSSGNIDEEDCTKFKFAPIADSQDQTYLTTITSPTALADKLVPTVLQVELHDGVWHYKTFYYQSMSEVVRESVTQFADRLFSDPWFMLFWIGLIGFVTLKIIRSKSEF